MTVMPAVTDCPECQARTYRTVEISDHVRCTGRSWSEHGPGRATPTAAGRAPGA
jgi:uncharacterized OB-fold protein